MVFTTLAKMYHLGMTQQGQPITNLIAKHTGERGCGAVTLVADVANLWRVDEAADALWRRYHTVQCSGCNFTVWADPIIGKLGTRECGAWCTEGTGRKCVCQCEGRNHGSAYSHTGALWQMR